MDKYDKYFYRLLIKEEIDAFKKQYILKHPDKAKWWWIEFFNNFILILICRSRKPLEQDGLLDQSFAQEGCSEKYNQMTMREFFSCIEQTLEDFGYQQEQLLKYFEKAKKRRSYFLRILENYYIKRWLKISIPLYIHFRIKGFNHSDLIK